MAEAVVCGGCGVRLSVAADRRGTSFDCPRCAAPVAVPEAEPGPAPSRIRFACPHCRAAHNCPPSGAGRTVSCQGCGAAVIVPAAVAAPAPGILLPPPGARPESRPGPSPSAPPTVVEWRPEPEPVGDDDEPPPYLPLRRRREQKAALWRSATLAPLGLSLLCFFLPWVRYSVLVPQERLAEDGRIEFASQSGLDSALGLASFHPALERWVRAETARAEAEWRRQGKRPLEEHLRANKPFMAPWLLAYPLCLLAAGVWTLISRPTADGCLVVGGLVGAAGVLVAVQFGVVGPPGLAALYDKLAQEGGGGVLLSLLIDTRYTTGFGLACCGLIAAVAVQGTALALRPRR